MYVCVTIPYKPSATHYICRDEERVMKKENKLENPEKRECRDMNEKQNHVPIFFFFLDPFSSTPKPQSTLHLLLL